MLFIIKNEEDIENQDYFIFTHPINFHKDKDAGIKFVISVAEVYKKDITDKELLQYFSTYQHLISQFQYENIKEEWSMKPENDPGQVFMTETETETVPAVFIKGSELRDKIDDYIGCLCIDSTDKMVIKDELMKQFNHIKMQNSKSYDSNREVNINRVPIELANMFNMIKGYLEWFLNSYSVRNNELISADYIEIESSLDMICVMRENTTRRLRYLKELAQKED